VIKFDFHIQLYYPFTFVFSLYYSVTLAS